MAGGARRRGVITDINVTPLVDIMLVLLVIFMLTAHLIAKQAIEVELPRAASSSTVPPTTLSITLAKDGSLYVNAERTPRDALASIVRAAIAADPKTQALIIGDKAVPHGDVVWVLDTVRSLGIASFAIQIEPRT